MNFLAILIGEMLMELLRRARTANSFEIFRRKWYLGDGKC